MEPTETSHIGKDSHRKLTVKLFVHHAGRALDRRRMLKAQVNLVVQVRDTRQEHYTPPPTDLPDPCSQNSTKVLIDQVFDDCQAHENRVRHPVHGDMILGECPVILSVSEEPYNENIFHFVQDDGEVVRMMGWRIRMVGPANVGMGTDDQMVAQAQAGLGRLR